LDLVQVLQVEELAQTIAGHLGLVLAVQVDKVCTELQAAEAAEAELVAVDHQVAELEAHKQQITQVDKVWTEQAQVAVETITLVETVQKEVQA
jgi:hypothetical protein